MIPEQAYGIIPFQKLKGKWHVLLVRHVKGNYWGFPKGHPNTGESPNETAERELFEETHLHIKRYLASELFHEAYDFIRNQQSIHKEVSYFLAEVEGDLKLQPSETFDAVWVEINKAENNLTFSQSQTLFKHILNIHKPLFQDK